MHGSGPLKESSSLSKLFLRPPMSIGTERNGKEQTSKMLASKVAAALCLMQFLLHAFSPQNSTFAFKKQNFAFFYFQTIKLNRFWCIFLALYLYNKNSIGLFYDLKLFNLSIDWWVKSNEYYLLITVYYHIIAERET